MIETLEKTIVHIEDDSDVRNLVREILKPMNIKLHQFSNLEDFKAESPKIGVADLYISDGEFPTKKGQTVEKNWHNVAEFVAGISKSHSTKGIMILSNNLPKYEETLPYSQIRCSMDKKTLEDDDVFYNAVETYLFRAA